MELRPGVTTETSLDQLVNLAANHRYMSEPSQEQPIPASQANHRFVILSH